MKSKLLVISLLFLSVVLVGCSNKGITPKEVKDSGITIDITELNGQTVTVKPGDIIYLMLTGEAGSGRQWLVSSPTTGSAIRLVDHKIIGLENPKILDGKFTDEWWIKILESEDFVLKFDYAILGKEVEDSYFVNIIQE